MRLGLGRALRVLSGFRRTFKDPPGGLAYTSFCMFGSVIGGVYYGRF